MKRPFYARLAIWGFLFVPLSMVVSIAVGNADGAFAFAPVAVPAVLAALVLRFTTRLPALIVAFLLALFVAMGSLFGDVLMLSHLESSTDFVPALIRAAGWTAAIVGVIASIVQRIRSAQRPANTFERRVASAIGAALVVFAIGSVVRDLTTRGTIGRVGGAVVVKTHDTDFDPDEIILPAGQRARVLVRNEDAFAHTFTVGDLGVDEYIGPHAEHLVSFDVPFANGAAQKTGRNLVLSCEVTGHGSMTGTIRIR